MSKVPLYVPGQSQTLRLPSRPTTGPHPPVLSVECGVFIVRCSVFSVWGFCIWWCGVQCSVFGVLCQRLSGTPSPPKNHEASQVQNLALTVSCAIQGYLAHKKQAPPLGPT